MIPTALPSGGSLTGFNPNSGSNTLVDETVNAALDQMEAVQQETNPVVGRDDNALDALYKLAQDNPEYWEIYLKLLAERENTTSAQKWYEGLANSQYTRAYKDIERAGLNPALLYQNLSGAGAGSVQPAGTWSTSPYSNKIAKENSDTQKAQTAAKIAGLVTTAIIGMLALLA